MPLLFIPSLKELASAFPDCVIIAYADNVWILGTPARAALAFPSFRSMYDSKLKGNLRVDKCMVYSLKFTFLLSSSLRLVFRLNFSTGLLCAISQLNIESVASEPRPGTLRRRPRSTSTNCASTWTWWTW